MIVEAWVRRLYWHEFAWHLTFHIPERQRARFDPDGGYVHTWTPGPADPSAAGDRDDSGEPLTPIVDLGEPRLAALAAVDAMKNL